MFEIILNRQLEDLARSPSGRRSVMRKYGLSVFFLAILVIAITLACGSSPPVLKSVSLSPPTADVGATQSSSRPRVISTNNPRRRNCMRLVGAGAIRTNELPPSRLAPRAWPSAQPARLAHIQFGPWPRTVAIPVAPLVRSLRTLAAVPANAKLRVQRN